MSSLAKLSIVMECSIRSICINASDEGMLTGKREDLWAQIVPRFHIPGEEIPIVRQEFLTHCLSNGSALTCYVQSLYRMSEQQVPLSEIERELGMLAVPHMNMFSDEQLSVQEMLYRNCMRDDNGSKYVPHQELFMIPLWILLLDLTASSKGETMLHRAQLEGILRMIDTLLRISGDRSTGGVASKLFEKVGGLFSRDSRVIAKIFKAHSDDFKTCIARPLGLFLLGRTLEWHSNATETKQEYQRLMTVMTKHMNGMKESDGKRKSALDIALNEYIREPSAGLENASELLRRLVTLVMFSDTGVPLWIPQPMKL
jgi:hypothetical protein